MKKNILFVLMDKNNAYGLVETLTVIRERQVIMMQEYLMPTETLTQYHGHKVAYRSIVLGEPDPELIKLTIYTVYTTHGTYIIW